jgi:hypothetical protein
MKFKTTQKNIKENYAAIISIGYCDAWYLLYFENPIAFTSGVYGWNADIYEKNNVAIVTGYRPFGNIHIDYDIIREYNKKAKTIIEDSKEEYENKKILLSDLLCDFISEALRK